MIGSLSANDEITTSETRATASLWQPWKSDRKHKASESFLLCMNSNPSYIKPKNTQSLWKENSLTQSMRYCRKPIVILLRLKMSSLLHVSILEIEVRWGKNARFVKLRMKNLCCMHPSAISLLGWPLIYLIHVTKTVRWWWSEVLKIMCNNFCF